MAQLGALPLLPLLAGGLLISTGVWLKRREAEEYEQWKATLPRPSAPPPPAAPKTREEMVTWTPEQMEKRNREAWVAWRSGAIPSVETAEREAWLWWGLGAVALISLLALWRS